MEVEKKVKDLIARQTRVSPSRLSANTDIRKLGVDSLMALELVANIEKVFRIRIPEDRIRTIRKVGQIVTMVMQLRQTGAPRTRVATR
mgnify:FL=1